MKTYWTKHQRSYEKFLKEYRIFFLVQTWNWMMNQTMMNQTTTMTQI